MGRPGRPEVRNAGRGAGGGASRRGWVRRAPAGGERRPEAAGEGAGAGASEDGTDQPEVGVPGSVARSPQHRYEGTQAVSEGPWHHVTRVRGASRPGLTWTGAGGAQQPQDSPIGTASGSNQGPQ